MEGPKLRKPLKEPHSSHSFLSDFILGSQDGLVNVLSILLGISAATTDLRLIYVASLAALGAESISMGAVAYTSTLARRRQYLKEVEREREMEEIPDAEREEVEDVLRAWGYKGEELETMADHIQGNPKAMLEFMMAFELKVAPVEVGAEAELRRRPLVHRLRVDHPSDPVLLRHGGRGPQRDSRLRDLERRRPRLHRGL